MTARLLEGGPIAAEIRDAVAEDVASFIRSEGRPPGLRVVIVGRDAPSTVYLERILRGCAKVGIDSGFVELEGEATEATVTAIIRELDDDPTVDGVIVQMPLPPTIRLRAVVDSIDPAKDIDGIHPMNAGLLRLGYDGFLPATAHAAVEILRRSGIEIAGRDAVVIGRSPVVGMPAAFLLVREDATVTVCHSRTTDLAATSRSADIVVVAAGHPGLVTGAMLKPGAVVVDVGINVVDGRLVGDVDFASAVEVASAITPVPGRRRAADQRPAAALISSGPRKRQADDQPVSSPRSLMRFPSDLEIARSVTPRPIVDVARDLGLADDELELYGPTKAKVTLEAIRRLEAQRPRGKYVVVTAITPTPLGEGKSTTTVGLAQGLNAIGRKAAVSIRQPSLGPVFGIKGGAAGGGYSQVIPMEDFNLHLTGDVHAIGAAHNLAGAFLDNSLHHKNPLGIDPHGILWPRVVDISDRALRHVVIGLGGREDGVPRETEFVITVGSEVMAVLALATDLHDLRARLGRIVLATTTDGQARHRRGPRRRRLDDRPAPRRHQAEPAPDARRRSGLRPRRPVRQHRPRQQLDHRGPPGARDQRHRLHRGGLRGRHGRREVLRHQVPGVRPGTGCGRRRRDGPGAQDARRRRQDRGRQAARSGAARGERRGGPARLPRTWRSRSRTSRSSGSRRSSPSTRSRPTRPPRSRRSARSRWRPVRATRSSPRTSSTAARARRPSPRRSGRRPRTGRADFQLLYPDEMPLADKIETIATQIYGADGVEFLPAARKSLKQYEELGYGHLPICMAKTQYSLSHDAALKNRPTGFTVPDPRGPAVRGRRLHHAAVRRDADDAGAAVAAGRREDRHRRRREHRRAVLAGRSRRCQDPLAGLRLAAIPPRPDDGRCDEERRQGDRTADDREDRHSAPASLGELPPGSATVIPSPNVATASLYIA